MLNFCVFLVLVVFVVFVGLCLLGCVVGVVVGLWWGCGYIYDVCGYAIVVMFELCSVCWQVGHCLYVGSGWWMRVVIPDAAMSLAHE